MKNCLVLFICIFFLNCSISVFASSDHTVPSGSTNISISAGSITSPTYYVASAGLAGDAVFSGMVANVWDGNNSIFFSSEQNSTLAYNAPFRDSAFDVDILLPRVTATLSDPPDSVTSISVDYIGEFSTAVNGFNGSDAQFVEAPEIIIAAPDGAGDTATATANVSSGELSIASFSGGTGYTVAPKVTIVGGPHFVKITDTSSNYYGRVFLIQDNGTNTLSFGNLSDTQRLSNAESSTALSTFIPIGTTVEIYAAQTLGNLFGLDTPDLPSGWTPMNNADDENSGSGPDLLYFWNTDFYGFETYFFSTRYKPSLYTGSGDNYSWGWKKPSRAFYPKTENNKVIYPDESFIIAKRSSGDDLLLVSQGSIESVNKQLYLPETGNSAILNNPYGTDLMLAELIPSTEIGTGTDQFRPGTSDSDGDVVTFLDGNQWKRFWYNQSHGNTNVTRMHVIGTRRPLGADDEVIEENDLYIGSGTVTNLKSCTNAEGTSDLESRNDSNYTKVFISGGIRDLKGFTITFEDINGRLLYNESNGTTEANATDGSELSVGSGSMVFSKLASSTHEIVGSGEGFVVINIQRDVNFASSEGSPAWSIGTLGSGYDAVANFYCLGGTAGTNAKGTISIDGNTISVTTAGSAYYGKPQAVVSGGGWRLGDNLSRCDEILGASSGLFIQRQKSGGGKTFIESMNPFE